MFRRFFRPSKFEQELMAELSKAHKVIENAHSAISSGQLHDKQVEKTLCKFKYDDIKAFRFRHTRRELTFYHNPPSSKEDHNV